MAALLLPWPARACSVCLLGGAGDGPNAGFYWSALLLTLLPLALAAGLGLWLRRVLRPGLDPALPGSGDRPGGHRLSQTPEA